MGFVPQPNLHVQVVFEPSLNINGEQEKRFGFPFPEEIKILYRWRNGCADQYVEPEEMFVFRDMGFLSTDDALAAREHVTAFLSVYESAGLDAPFAADTVFPIAGFEGQYYVVPCSDHAYKAQGKHPVVTVGEDLSVHFFSISTMLDTCIAWVRDPKYTSDNPEPADEMRAWQRFNPGVFDEQAL